MTGDYAGMSWRALRLAREEPGQVLRLHAFRAAHPEVIIGDGGFEVCITVAVSRPVTALQLSVAHDSSGVVTYRHLLSAGPLQAASAARRVL
jgi:hypothetical protein